MMDFQQVMIVGEEMEDGSFLVSLSEDDYANEDASKEEPTAEEAAAPSLYFCNACNVDIHSLDEHVAEFHSEAEVVLEIEEPVVEEKSTVPLDKTLEVEEYDEERETPNKEHTCGECGTFFSTRKSLLAHEKVHSLFKTVTKIPAKTAFECEICSTILHSNKSLILHKRMHETPARQYNKLATDNEENRADVYECMVCSERVQKSLRAEHEKAHNDECFVCGKCNRRFNTEEDLDMHKILHSTSTVKQTFKASELSYPCGYCGRVFYKPYDKLKHERIHTGEKPYKCDICGKKFRVAYCKSIHMKTHSDERPFTCEHCGKKFKANKALNFHLLTHSDVRGYKCDECPKSFKTAVQLSGHKKSHSKPFLCKECNRPFSSLYSVRLHTETHKKSDNFKFKCDLCGAKYARSFALKDHIRQTHFSDEIEVVTLSTNKTLPE